MVSFLKSCLTPRSQIPYASLLLSPEYSPTTKKHYSYLIILVALIFRAIRVAAVDVSLVFVSVSRRRPKIVLHAPASFF